MNGSPREEPPSRRVTHGRLRRGYSGNTTPASPILILLPPVVDSGCQYRAHPRKPSVGDGDAFTGSRDAFSALSSWEMNE
jgi:hypothetical protein